MTAKTKRNTFRIAMIVLAVVALGLSVSAYVTYTINLNYFPHQSHSADVLWISALLILAALFVLEAIFLMVFRKFTPNI